MRKGDKSRLFCFIGYKTEAEAATAKKFFHNTFIDTSRIVVDFAKPQGDPELPRAWSKFSKGSSAYQALHGKDDGSKKSRQAISEAEREAKAAEVEKKKDRFRSFLSAMGLTKDNRQSWNDNFAAFMADEGSGLLHTSKAEDDKKKRKQKEAEKEKKKEETKAATAEDDADKEMIDEYRLYVMNLPFTISHEELRELFSRFGEV